MRGLRRGRHNRAGYVLRSEQPGVRRVTSVLFILEREDVLEHFMRGHPFVCVHALIPERGGVRGRRGDVLYQPKSFRRLGRRGPVDHAALRADRPEAGSLLRAELLLLPALRACHFHKIISLSLSEPSDFWMDFSVACARRASFLPTIIARRRRAGRGVG